MPREILVFDEQAEVGTLLQRIYKKKCKVVEACEQNFQIDDNAAVIIIDGRHSCCQQLVDQFSSGENTKNIPIIVLVENVKKPKVSSNDSTARYLSLSQPLIDLRQTVNAFLRPAKS